MTDIEFINSLVRRVENLEGSLVETTLSLAKVCDVGRRYDEDLVEHLRSHDRELTDIFDRLAHIESFLFPELAKDLKSVDDIIGDGDGKAVNKMDRRDL